ANLAGDLLPRLFGAIRHRHQLDAGLGLQLRDVMLARVGAGPDEAAADGLVPHDRPTACWMQVSRSSSAARVKAHMLASRSARPVSSVRAASMAPATAKQECTHASPY